MNTAAVISISTAPPTGSVTSLARRPTGSRPLVGLVARLIAGVTGALLGIAIGLVSAGFDATPMLLAVGAVALGFGLLVTLATRPTASSPTRR